MAHKSQTQRKQILSDPLAEFSTAYPDASTDDKNQLSDLCNKSRLLKANLNDAIDKIKITSKKIGEAKKNNLPAIDLIQSMQALSIERKSIESSLRSIEDQIIDCFPASRDVISPSSIVISDSANNRYRISDININDITVSLLKNEDEAWNSYVLNQPAACIHHLTHWRDIFYKTYKLESLYYFAQDKNKNVVGILPLTRLKSRLFGDLLVSMPYFQRGGAVADHPLIEDKLMQAAANEASLRNINHIELRDDAARNGMPVQSHKVNMILSLPESDDMLWDSFTPKLRAQIKRPLQHSPQIFIGGREYLDDFYQVYTQNMRDLGSPAHSKQLIENIIEQFPDSSWVITVRLNNKPVSAAFLLGHDDTIEIPLASTIRSANRHSINMLLYWTALKLSIKYGYKYFDFGRSSIDAGTYRFKQQWGAEPKQLYWHYWLSKGSELPSLNPSNPKYRFIIHIWTKMPVFLSRLLSRIIVQNIP
ncbi:MAG: FemAB family PEP-CTERM system-associated protein [Gammaproteobacteria bacterium]|nr:FemAB family PEP-CTERM system-associated protein [Gammaproteobacteria bacterium]